MNLPDFLVEWPHGEIVLRGHRIGLYHVIIYRREGYSAERLHEQFPTLPLELIRDVLAFHGANRAEVDVYVDRCREELDRQEAAAPRVSWDELLRRYEAKHRAPIR
jgi:uncharacterized protein (DUF433 family)